MASPSEARGDVAGGAVLVSDTYRYELWRGARSAGPVWVMLNPSAADAFTDDPTIRSVGRISGRLGHGSFSVVNLFGWRTPDPDALHRAWRDGEDVVGPVNDAHVAEALARAADRCLPLIAAWGAHPLGGVGWARLLERDPGIASLPWRCVGVNLDGSPKHPLYQRADVPLCAWNPAEVTP